MERSRGSFSTKNHARADGYGRPHKLLLSHGQSHEGQLASALIESSEACFIVGDREYDSDTIRKFLKTKNIVAVIPPTLKRKKKYHYDKMLYKERNIVERFFAKVKQFRRIATRYDKTSTILMSVLNLVGILIWLKL